MGRSWRGPWRRGNNNVPIQGNSRAGAIRVIPVLTQLSFSAVVGRGERNLELLIDRSMRQLLSNHILQVVV